MTPAITPNPAQGATFVEYLFVSSIGARVTTQQAANAPRIVLSPGRPPHFPR
jgi:hypothetical protein